MMKKAIINGNEVMYDDVEFVYYNDGHNMYFKYIGDGKSPIHNPEGNTSCYKMFSEFDGDSLNLSEFDTSSVIDMERMFEKCESLKDLDLSNFDTSNVIEMSAMFYDCTLLKVLNLSNFNTSNVSNMRHMFNGCVSLKDLDLSNFDTSRVKNMDFMLSGCKSLESLNMPGFGTLMI